MSSRRHPDQPKLAWAYSTEAYSTEIKRIKRLKRVVARAGRIRLQGLGPRDVACPHCGAPAFLSLKRDYECRGGKGPYRRTNNRYSGYHKTRIEAAESFKARILGEGAVAASELAVAARPPAPVPDA